MKLKFLRTSLNQSNICCSFFWGKFLQDEEVSETSAKDYRISRTGFKINGKFIKTTFFETRCSFFWGKFLQDEEVSETRGTDYGISRIGFKIIEKFIKLKFLRTF